MHNTHTYTWQPLQDLIPDGLICPIHLHIEIDPRCNIMLSSTYLTQQTSSQGSRKGKWPSLTASLSLNVIHHRDMQNMIMVLILIIVITRAPINLVERRFHCNELNHSWLCELDVRYIFQASIYKPMSPHIDDLEQDCSISSALAMEILQSCTKPSTCWVWSQWGQRDVNNKLRIQTYYLDYWNPHQHL